MFYQNDLMVSRKGYEIYLYWFLLIVIFFYFHYFNFSLCKLTMEEFNPPRNQLSRLESARENMTSADNTSEASLSTSRLSMERQTQRSPDTQLYRADQETDMLSRQNLSQEFQINDSGNACNSCHSCGQTLRMHSTPVKRSVQPGDFTQNSLQQIGSISSDNITGPFNMSRLKTATDSSQIDGSQSVNSTTGGKKKVKSRKTN